MSTPIDTLGLSSGALNALVRAGVCTVESLAQYSMQEVAELRGIGWVYHTEIITKAVDAGHSFQSGTIRISKTEAVKLERRRLRQERELSRVKEMHQMYLSGMTYREVGCVFSVTRQRIEQLFKEYQLPHGKGVRDSNHHREVLARKEMAKRAVQRRRRAIEMRMRAIADEYLAGAGYLTLAKKYHVQTGTLKKYFQKFGVSSRPVGCWLQRNRLKMARRITVNGITKTVSEWAEYNKISRNTIWARLNIGWPEVRAVTEPPRAYGNMVNN